MFRYARATDWLETEQHSEVFADDCVFASPHSGDIVGVDAVVEWMNTALARFEATQHLIGNIWIEFTGPDSANAVSYESRPSPGRRSQGGELAAPRRISARRSGRREHSPRADQVGTTIDRDPIVVVLQNTLTSGERYLADNGRSAQVLDIRAAYQEVISSACITAIEDLTDRTVAAFHRRQPVDLDIAAEIFVLKPQCEPTLRGPNAATLLLPGRSTWGALRLSQPAEAR